MTSHDPTRKVVEHQIDDGEKEIKMNEYDLMWKRHKRHKKMFKQIQKSSKKKFFCSSVSGFLCCRLWFVSAKEKKIFLYIGCLILIFLFNLSGCMP